uniref:Uncharacterized protein n=1 Tax=Shewanella decolorationis TaxID=256839 RepID=A0A5B8R6Z6_9GAMM
MLPQAASTLTVTDNGLYHFKSPIQNTSQALRDDLSRLKYPIFKGISAIYCLRCCPHDC